MSWIRPISSLIIFGYLITCGFVHIARADDGGRDSKNIEEARRVFLEGIKERDAGNSARACGLFLQSYNLFGNRISAFQVANCWENAGRTKSAQRIFDDIAREARHDGDIVGAEEALARARALDGRHSTIFVNVSPEAESIPGLTVYLDKTLVLPRDWNRTRLAVDAGKHKMTISALHYRTMTVSTYIEKVTTAHHIDVPVLERLENAEKTDIKKPAVNTKRTAKEAALLGGGITSVFIAAGLLVGQGVGAKSLGRDEVGALQTVGFSLLAAGTFVSLWGFDSYRTRKSALENVAVVPFVTPTLMGFGVMGQF